MGAFEGVNKCLSGNIVECARLLNYSESNILILEGDENKLKIKYPNVYLNILSCSHHRDSRTPFRYAQDLVASWVLEDIVLSCIKKCGYEIELYGADRNREILASVNTSSQSDYMIKVRNQKFLLELMTDYTGYWKRTHRLDLRDNKYIRLKNEKSLLMAISTLDKKFIILNCAKEKAHYIPNHAPWGGKPVYQLNLDDNKMSKFTYTEVVLKIDEYIKYYDL